MQQGSKTWWRWCPPHSCQHTDPKHMPLPYMLYYAKFGRSSQTIQALSRGPKNLAAWGPAIGIGDVLTHQKKFPPPHLTMPNLLGLGQTVRPYVEDPKKFGSTWVLPLGIRSMPDHLRNNPHPFITMPYLVALGETIWAQTGGPKTFGSAGSQPLEWGVDDPQKHTPRVNMPNLVVSAQTVQVWNLAKSWLPCILPFKVTQDHQNQQIDQLPVTYYQ